ncbi:hypothetical protein [Amycolatopsis sp. FDAARGOS 1241]|uniref:hypothetical protein n=1 Tax=Amycolatopsis sp. FDAARGOS 1241 TaxID=2778070 RepID=UPI00194FBE4F|nr:hypothetical protein [Amycolatopsis sp. FDAARGOS 1241]QRP47410.1 hypothetical protein I6J71_05425 [Amycolatopsis sp. FDAARGOS 1241]
MAKSVLPNFKSGGGLIKKAIGVVILLAVLALVIRHPHDAAGMVNSAKDQGGGVIDSVAKFFQDLGHG